MRISLLIYRNTRKRIKHEKYTKNTRKIHEVMLCFASFVVYYKRGDDDDTKTVTYIKWNEPS